VPSFNNLLFNFFPDSQRPERKNLSEGKKLPDLLEFKRSVTLALLFTGSMQKNAVKKMQEKHD
jgi:hypothetical protein